MPVARRTDPETSWEAAHSIADDGIKRIKDAIIVVLRTYGALCHCEIYEHVSKMMKVSLSGCRTRVAELRDDDGLVEWNGDYVLHEGQSRRHRLWSLVEE